MDSIRYLFFFMHSYSGPVVRMGYDSDIHTKGVSRIDLEDRYFNDVLYIQKLATMFLSVYQMTNAGEVERVTFTHKLVEIA